MSRSFPFLVFVAALIATPAALRAQTPTDGSDGLPPYRANAFLGAHHSDQAGAAMIEPAVDLSDRPASADRLYAWAPWNDDPLRTAFDYRFAPDGLEGSVGYLRVDDGRPLDRHAMGLAPPSRFDRSGALVGASFSFAFR